MLISLSKVQTISEATMPLVKELVQAECVRCPWLQAETKVATILGIFPLFFFSFLLLLKVTVI
jgi:hypothetical protein